jgi:cytoskeletal protein RodZ
LETETRQTAGNEPSIATEDREAFAEFLAAARRRSGRSIEEIARDTRIATRYLDALERGRVEVLPAGVYRRAIVRTYAASVGLNPGAAIERFDRTFGAAAAVPALSGVDVAGMRRDEPRHVATRLRHKLVAAAATLVLSGTVVAYVVARDEPRVGEGVRAMPHVALLPDRTQAASANDRTTQSTGTSGRPAPETPVSDERATDRADLNRDRLGDGPTTATPPVEEEPTLIVRSAPAGARVTVNGIAWGITPVTIGVLPPGAKVIRVTKDGYLAGERHVQLAGGDTAVVRLTLRARP